MPATVTVAAVVLTIWVVPPMDGVPPRAVAVPLVHELRGTPRLLLAAFVW